MQMNNKNFRILMFIGLAWGLISVWREMSMNLTFDHNWGKLLSPGGVTVISVYVLIFAAGLSAFLVGLYNPDAIQRVSKQISLRNALRWIIFIVLLLTAIYVYLYSSWQNFLSTPWLQLLFSMGFAQIVLVLLSPNRSQQFGWSEAAYALMLFIYPRVVLETRILASGALPHRVVTVIGFAGLVLLAVALYSNHSERIRERLIAWRNRLGIFRPILLLLICILPIFHRYLVQPETYIIYDDIRFAIFLAAVWLAAYLMSTGPGSLVTRDALGLSLGVLIFTAFLARQSILVIDYPLSLTWSEGNRLYDYSLVFGQSLYNYDGRIINPYSSPGRYGLWGVLFLWEGLPIWAHRLWNLILHTLPVLIFAALITRKLKPAALRYGMLLWILLFLTSLVPLHPPFMVVSAIVALSAFDESPTRRGSALAVAALYAGSSRLTWIFAPAAMGVLIDLLLYYPRRNGVWWRRLMPTVILTVISVAAGLIPSIETYISLAGGSSITSNQPLLWYRLFPNSSILGMGVMFLALAFTLPLLLILTWWIISRRWQMDWVQKTAVAGALIGFFAAGLIVSAKIGGGGDLHNLDMFLITLILVIVLGLMWFAENNNFPSQNIWVTGLAVYMIVLIVYPFTPLNAGSTYHPYLELPNQNQVTEALTIIRDETAQRAGKGDILFMDQRQLLTFGYVDAIPFVPEYEKKYMMDQAMGSNAQYFSQYHQDLASKRFSLIVTEKLKTELKENLGLPFAEESDAWVIWVSNPTLCFYEPIYTSKKTNIQLLVPRQNPVGCEEHAP